MMAAGPVAMTLSPPPLPPQTPAAAQLPPMFSFNFTPPPSTGSDNKPENSAIRRFSSRHQPAVPSPLSSSPLRNRGSESPSPPRLPPSAQQQEPETEADPDAMLLSSPSRPPPTTTFLFSSPLQQRQQQPLTTTSLSQSSPLQPRDSAGSDIFGLRRQHQSSENQQHQTKPGLFRFASRGDGRVNPLLQRQRRGGSEEAREGRRRLFLKGVRERAEDARWERRGGDQELLRLEFLATNRRVRELLRSDAAGAVFLDPDLEEASGMLQDSAEEGQRGALTTGDEADLTEMLIEQEEAELDAYLMDYAEGANGIPPSSSMTASQSVNGDDWIEDDREYDEIFMEFLEGNGASDSMDI